MRVFVCVGLALLAGLLTENPSYAQANNDGRCANCGAVGPHYVTALGPALACPVLRNLVYFYKSALNLADPEDIDAFVKAHDCAILTTGARYRLLGFGSGASGIVVGTTSMYVLTETIQGQ
jgi:hypothetical protein